MSLTYTITPPGGRTHKPMRLAEAVRLGPKGLRPYFEPEENGGSEDLAKYARRRTDSIIAHLGISPYSARGFEFNYENKAYTVRVLTPSAPNDWRIALDFLAALSNHLGAPIVGEDDETYTPGTITGVDFHRDIRAGLASLRHTVVDKGSPSIVLPGVIMDVAFDRDMVEAILRADSPADEFGTLMGWPQHTDAFVPRQVAARAPDGSVHGIYTLTESVDTVLPLSPTLPPHVRSQVGHDATVSWELALVAIDGPGDDPNSYASLGTAEFAAALRALPTEKVSRFDADKIHVRGLDGTEIRALLDAGRGA